AMVEPALDGSLGRSPEMGGKSGKNEGRVFARPSRHDYAAADFGRRPRRAAARPGIPPAQSSHRSACFAPRRASAKLIRITAPRPSATSFEQLSQTSLVTRANAFPPWQGFRLVRA